MVGYFMTCVSLAIICGCHCIGVEYYDDKSVLADKRPEHAVIAKTRRVDDGDNLNNPSVREHEGSHCLTSNTSADVQSRRKLNVSCTKTKHNDCESSSFTDLPKENVLMHSNFNTTILPLDILKEYEYTYDDDTMVPRLRQSLEDIEQDIHVKTSESNVRIPLNEFYSLEPAIQHVKVNIHDNSSKQKNLWYILEDMSCWELPLLYGELGRKAKSFDVFLMHAGKLKNVIEKSDNKDWNFQRLPLNTRLTYYTSKWCTVEPCYGDHTLCLFSDTAKSSLCDKQYRVEVLNILEQTTLVNTLNSMRNKVASGKSVRYRHLPPAGNMRQVIYDDDLEQIAKVWLQQCLPGTAPCSALDGSYVTQLECTKYAKLCCIHSQSAKCTPKTECSLLPVIGCLHVWFWSAGDKLTTKEVQCGHTSAGTYSTAQLLWATTYKIGCAYAQISNGDIRVICNFSPGAPFVLETRLYCGIIGQSAAKKLLYKINTTDAKILRDLGIDLNRMAKRQVRGTTPNAVSKLKLVDEGLKTYRGVDTLSRIYKEGWIRQQLKDYSNGTKSMIARLVTKYEFIEQNGARCDSEQPMYAVAAPGSSCVERGRRYRSLCYDYRDPTPGYRAVAVLAPVALFSLILYDLFSGVIRQTNY